MVRQARVLAQATSDLVNAMRSDAEVEVDVDNSKKLLAAAKLLADATARMVEAAKVSSLEDEKILEDSYVLFFFVASRCNVKMDGKNAEKSMFCDFKLF